MINLTVLLLLFVAIIIAETVFVLQFFKKTGFVHFPAIAPMRWLAILLAGWLFQTWTIQLLVLFFLMAIVFWIITNVINNLLVFKQPFYEIGKFGIFGKILSKIFPKNTALWGNLTRIILAVILGILYFKTA